MDIPRILILFGMAATAYMLILAWNEDYGQNTATDRRAAERHEAANQSDGQPVNTDAGNLPDFSATTPIETDSMSEAGHRSVDPLPEAANLPDQGVPVAETRRNLIQVTTDVLDVRIDLHGGDIVRVALPGYPVSLDTPDDPFLLLDPGNDYTAKSGLLGPDGTDKDNFRPQFTSARSSYVLGDGGDDELSVVLVLEQASGVEITKTYRFKRGDYLMAVEYDINNITGSNWQGALSTWISRNSQQPFAPSENGIGLQPYLGGATRSQSELYHKLEFEDLEEDGPYKTRVESSYMAMVQHYFVSAWILPDGQGNTYQARKVGGRDLFLFSVTTPLISVAPGSRGHLAARFYAGPKDQYRLSDIAQGLDLTIDYGFLWWLAQPLFYLLTMLQGFVVNWGLAIICLTIIVKMVLYPLSAASFRSVAKMRKLQPEMVRLKERYGDDRQKMSQSMMELYKREGANPLGGCVPLLLQMPVFLALYWALMESVELRQTPFIFWIRDLSAMDPYFILPILMGISMYCTQLMNPEPPDPVQAKVFKFMPVIFTFFFLWFPSGLVLYWLVNNILTVMQQYYVTRKVEKGG